MGEKAKTRGRRGRLEFWREHIRRREASGASEGSYCRANELSRSSMRYWRKRLGVEAVVPKRKLRRQAPAFVAVEVVGAPREARLPDPRWVAEVIRHLAMAASP
jgi:hypothetical protein